jgi:hypothetical protein
MKKLSASQDQDAFPKDIATDLLRFLGANF